MEKNINGNVKEDRRVRKTKKSLRDSLFRLLGEKSVNQITVTELTTLADVNRSTFYIYYNDVFDMMDKIQEEIYNVLVEKVIRYNNGFARIEDYEEYCTGFLNFCKENQDLIRFVTRNDCNNQLADRIKEAVKEIIPDSAKYFAAEDPRYYMTTFALSGMLSVILSWLDDGMKIPAADMAKFLSYTYVFGASMQKNGDFYKNYSYYSGTK